MPPFATCLKDAQKHGVLVGVELPGTPDPVPDEVLAQLFPDERAHALGLRGFRQVEWVGGRLAAHRAIELLGHVPAPVLSDERGAPRLQSGDPALSPQGPLALSISHKRDLALALVARASNGHLGLDLEDLLPERMGVVQRVLTPAERAQVETLPPERRWTAVVLRFSLKEAVYKALAPTLARYIDFQEAEVEPNPDGTARVRLDLARAELVPRLSARFTWLPGRVLSTVRARWP